MLYGGPRNYVLSCVLSANKFFSATSTTASPFICIRWTLFSYWNSLLFIDLYQSCSGNSRASKHSLYLASSIWYQYAAQHIHLQTLHARYRIQGCTDSVSPGHKGGYPKLLANHLPISGLYSLNCNNFTIQKLLLPQTARTPKRSESCPFRILSPAILFLDVEWNIVDNNNIRNIQHCLHNENSTQMKKLL